MSVPSPRHSQDVIPSSQILSLSSSQMEELEMSPGYDIDNEPLNFAENAQRGKSQQKIISTGLQGHNNDQTRREKEQYHGLSESEVITSDVAIQGGGYLCEKAVVSEKDACCSERGSQAISSSSRKRPHPDSR